MSNLTFSPLIDPALLIGLSAVALIICLYTLWRAPLAGFWRLVVTALFILFLVQPRLTEMETTGLPDIALLIIDESASQKLDNRDTATTEALETLEERLGDLPDVELRTVTIANNTETQIGTAIEQGLTDIPRAQLAGIFILSDGQAHDISPEEATGFARTAGVDAPIHLLLTGREDEKDRVLEILNAPRFGIINETATIKFKVNDTGLEARLTTVNVKVNGRDAVTQPVRIGEDVTVQVPLDQPGKTVLELTAAAADGELTTRNNKAIIQISVIRDRLRVLLVSGEPHAGERVWRNLLKSDPAVDLIHFTILKPSTKPLVAAQSDLALIRFPENELFLEKLDQFDVLIFDRYTYRGVLNPLHFNRITEYVENGGAMLIASGPEFASPSSIAQQRNLAYILPALPNGTTYTESFVPIRNENGQRHPITKELENEADWGRWLRSIGVTQRGGRILMEGANNTPLLIVDRVRQGRVGLLLSDHVWLWARDFDGGGPHRELLRRLVHWLMKEPELEEDAIRISANVSAGTVTITRRSLADEIAAVTLTAPDGSTSTLILEEDENGRWASTISVSDAGLYSVTTDGENGDTLYDITAFGLATPTEFQNVLATPDILRPLITSTGGGLYQLRQENRIRVPSIRQLPMGRAATGRGSDTGWAGIYRRNAEQIDNVKARALIPAALWLLLFGIVLLGMWLTEGKNSLFRRR